MRNLNGGRIVRDRRNGLIKDFGRFVEAILPRTVMMENVPRLSQHSGFFCFVNLLERLKYRITWSVLDAADYGVPQRRQRLILLASRSSAIGFAEPDQNRKTVFEAIGDLPLAGKSGDPAHDIPECRSKKITRLIKKIPPNGGSRSALKKGDQLGCHHRCDGFKDVYGRMAWDDVAPTITSGCHNPSKGRFLHPEEDRAITIREAALLQSFPPRYKFPPEYGKERLAALIGNALPPEFIRRQATQVRFALISK